MARDYGKVTHRFWTGETGKQIRSLGLEARVVATYLLTCSSSNMIGLYYLPLMLLAHESGTSLEGASKALQSLSEAGFAHYDEADELVFIPQMARVQIGDALSAGDRQRLGVIAQLKEYKKSRFVADFVGIYKEAYHLPEDLVTKPLSKPLRSPLPSPHEVREQRTESREQRTEPPSACACDPRAPEQDASSVSESRTTIRTADGLIHWLRIAIEKHQPQIGPWNSGGSFAKTEARGFLESFTDVIPEDELRKRVELFALDAAMAPWTVKKFVAAYNGIGQERARAGPRAKVRGSVPDEW